MFDMIPFTSPRSYKANKMWDPFQEFFGAVVHSAATDIRETDNDFTIETELPGYDKSELSVNIKEGVLTVRAEHQAQADNGNADEGYIRRERSAKTIERQFQVSGVDTEAIRAEYTNGVLKLTLPKLPEVIPQQHQIEIQ